MAKKNRARKGSKRKDERPARKRYWDGKHLMHNKVRNLMRCCGMTKAEAISFWKSSRRTRMPLNYLR